MAYILYIPNTECGPSAYTQRSFETLRELARWSMEQALDSPAPALVPPPAPAPIQIVDYLPVIQQSTPLESLIEESIERKPISYYLNPMCQSDEIPDFIRSLDQLIVDKNWEEVAKKYSAYMPFSTPISRSSQFNQSMPADEVEFITKLVYNYAAVIPTSPLIRYNTSKFNPNVETYLLEIMRGKENLIFLENKGGYHLSDAIQVYRVLREFLFHPSWEWLGRKLYPGISLPAFRNTLEHMNMDYLVNLCSTWIREEEPTDSMRELIISLYTVQTYKYVSNATSQHIGSSNFLTTYINSMTAGDTNISNSLNALPLRFRLWISDGVTHSTCTSSLEKLGVPKVRRAEGQRYIGLEALPAASQDRALTYYSLMNVSWKRSETTDCVEAGIPDGVCSDICGGLSNYLSPIN